MTFLAEGVEFHPQKLIYGLPAVRLVASDAANPPLFIQRQTLWPYLWLHINGMVSPGAQGMTFET